jgi:hypothetical protein
MFLGGIITTYFSIFGVVIAIIGAFVAFTSTSTILDINRKRIKLSNNLFGIFPVGKWIDIKPDMKIGIKRSHRGYEAYIRVIQPIGIYIHDFRIFLYDSANKPIMPINKFESFESSKAELNNLNSMLGLDIIPNQNLNGI